MTRDEAILKVTTALCKPNEPYWCPPGVALQDAASDLARRATEAVDIAVALGLKLDEPKTVEQEAADLIKRCTTLSVAAVDLSFALMKTHGFKIVRSD